MNQQQIDAFREALKFSPDNLPLRKLLADSLFNLARYEEALPEYKETIRLSPDNIALKISLADTFFHLKNYSTARFLLEEILDNQPNQAHAALILAKVLLETNELKEAKQVFDNAVDENPNLYDADFEDILNKKIRESGLALSNDWVDEIEQMFIDTDLEKPKIAFKDVGGMDAVKEEIALKVIHPMTNPDIYKAFGKKIGGGILLYGPPGCGKTLLARATAGEINANFISVGLNDVLDMWIGSSEKNLHNIFQEARLNAPCVLFFDEVDALGASRSDMRQAAGRFIINQFLDEMDGVKYSNEGVLILGATNCPWYLDAAFRRPGRFDRIIFVQPPDQKAREEILKIQLAEKPVENVDIQSIAKQTQDYSGADLKATIDIAVELKLPESLKQGRVIPITNSDLKNAISKHKATTKEWFATAKNYALYSNESGLYDDILKYLKLK
ncbi:ATP-dependent zinc metalloprotease FtsH [Emticicia aquatica]|jgi:SpoVK/Ycf46/Vps4 family AAA+-type ATPase|uniref:ATP-dependent zinc metalloprotease FtsH n=1 Tax=Emticicia aquatica TaxID=1681835 RepID=A0ABM9AN46_9BACT|nr:ATP-binding protein [Emticicia aquatica]CAH0994703.1 ATP-dependent zinc metalloprotease FtsH [Emticicia aquatica]